MQLQLPPAWTTASQRIEGFVRDQIEQRGASQTRREYIVARVIGNHGGPAETLVMPLGGEPEPVPPFGSGPLPTVVMQFEDIMDVN